jgi:hypothetical protein
MPQCFIGAHPAFTLNLVELLVAANPDTGSRLPYLIRVPVGPGLVFATAGNLAPYQGALLPPAAKRCLAHRTRDRRTHRTARGRDVVF